MRTITRGGAYVRVADPSWRNPLDGGYSQRAGGRWNAPGAFPVVYLCRTVSVARAVVFHQLEGHPYGPEDLNPSMGPVLVETTVRSERFVDAITARGLESTGLTVSYPRDGRGQLVGWSRCQPLGQEAWEDGCEGIACRSAAPTAPTGGEELAWFVRGRRRLRLLRKRPFAEWFWAAD
jgi:RES domain-containing protein